MRKSMKTHSGKKEQTCDICGDVGFNNALSTCCSCHISHEHIYCMKDNVLEVPKEWFCEACLSSNMKDHRGEDHLCKKGKTLCTESDSPKMIESTNTRNVVKFSSPPRDPAFSPPKKNYIKVVDTGKVKFLPAEDVVALTSGTSKKASTWRSGLSSLSSQVGSLSVPHYPNSRRTPISVAEASKRFSQKKSACRSSRPPTPPTPQMVGRVKQSSSLQQEVVKSPPQDIPAKEKSNEPKNLDKPSGKALVRPNEEYISEKEPVDAIPLPKKPRTPLTRTEAVYTAENASSPFLEANPNVLSKPEELPNQMVGRVKQSSSLQQEVKSSPQDIPAKEKSNVPKKLDKPSGKVLVRPNEEYISEKGPVDAILLPKKPRTPLTRTEAVYTAQNASSPLLEANPNVLSKPEELPNHPAINPTWKGSFEIPGRFSPGRYYEYEGLQAHPPQQVSRKAYEFSKQMPITLQFKVHPRCDVWSDIFHIDCPTGDDIALYFLSEDFRSSKEKYHCLLEFIEREDLAMSTCLNGVELIIFTSRQLPMDSQRLNMKFFLWGVFRPTKKQLLSLSVTEATNQVEDMEIDMVGGEDIGRVDYVLKKPILERNKVQFTIHTQKTKYPISSDLDFRKLNSSKNGDGVAGCRNDEAGPSGCRNDEAGPSPNVVSNVHSDQPMTGNITPTPKIKIEISDVAHSGGDFGAPPGFSRTVASGVARKGGDFNAPPGFSRTVTSDLAHKGGVEKPLGQVPTVGRNLDRPPGFSQPKVMGDPSEFDDKKEKAVLSQNSSKMKNRSQSYPAKRVFRESPELPFISQQVVNHGFSKISTAPDPTPSAKKGKFQGEHCVKTEPMDETEAPRMRSLSTVYMKDDHHQKQEGFRK